MDEEKEREPLKFKNSRMMEILCKIAIGVLFFFSVRFYCGAIFSIVEIVDYFGSKSFEGYYCFDPSAEYYLEIMNDSSKADLLFRQIHEWQEKNGLKVIQFRPDVLFREDKYTVYTYWKSKYYEVEWQEASLDMSKGEWFQGDEEAFIIIRGNYFDVGDEVVIKDNRGKMHSIPVIGKTKKNWIYGSGGFVDHIKFDRQEKTVLLLNPACALNPEVNYIEESTLTFLTDSPAVIQTLKEKGTLKRIEKIISRDKSFMENMTAVFLHFGELRLYFIPMFILCFAGFLFLIYHLHKKNWAAGRWVFLLAGLLFGNYFCVRDYGGMVQRNPVIMLSFLAVVILYDIYMKKNNVHGRSYIVDGWDEKDVNL